MLLHPAFPEKDLERLRTQRLARLLTARLDSPEAIAGVVFPRLLYGAEHPYGRPDIGTPKSVKGLTRDDVVAFHKRLFLPNNAGLIVVGDTTPDAIIADARGGAEGLEAGRAARGRRCPSRPPPKGVTVYLVDKPARRAVGPGRRAGRRARGARPTTSR